MDLSELIKKVKKSEEHIDIQEAFNIYNLLRTRYMSIQTVKLFKNFICDIDWEVILEGFHKNSEKQIKNLEKVGGKFGIIMPNRPPLDIEFATRIKDITDDYIYKKIYHDFVADLMSLIHAVRSTSTNDNLRKFLMQDLIINFEDFDILYKFGKLKGWEDTYPIYKTAINQLEEELADSEAFHIWDHITMRYEQIELIGVFAGFAHDTEFKAILQHGLYTFNKQISTLEQLALKLNVPIPNRPSLPVLSPIDPAVITDKFMYQIILSWEFASLDAHVSVIIETIRNDALRKLWSDCLNTELEYYDKYLKCGKMKGWTRVVPIYRESVT